jgi:ubiquinone/menaquinone biosynthesis C-methylase UbiE
MQNHNDVTKAAYQATAQQFAENVSELAPTNSIERFAQMLPPNAKMIDIGSGSGRDAKLFSELGVKVTGIDFSPNMIEIAKAHAPQATFQLMEIEKINFPALSFDGAWAACSLVHISKENLPAVLANIYQILKTNGYFYLSIKKGTQEGLETDNRYAG